MTDNCRVNFLIKSALESLELEARPIAEGEIIEVSLWYEGRKLTSCEFPAGEK